ncbi:hypothetical protein IWZ03DRAFT_66952 [Phyllosticta citriasiana]|uniref:Secreted protein n=1 Tax=Phyllosticta citriasiana TaxID=595635 RepID=A0ABR1KBW5_9PEZI
MLFYLLSKIAWILLWPFCTLSFAGGMKSPPFSPFSKAFSRALYGFRWQPAAPHRGRGTFVETPLVGILLRGYLARLWLCPVRSNQKLQRSWSFR